MTVHIVTNRGIALPIPSRTMYEIDYENEILGQANHLFSGWRWCSFKVDVEAPSTGHGTKRADFALIEATFSEWWVVEVELAHHSVEGHVAPQIETLALGQYGSAHAEVIISALNLNAADAASMHALIKRRLPKVLVIVDDYVETWKSILSDFASLLVVKPFKAADGTKSYLVDGNLPERDRTYLTICIQDRSMPLLILIQNPERLSFRNGSIIPIECSGGMTQWKYYVLGQHHYISPHDTPSPLGEERELILGVRSNGVFFLKSMNSRIRRSLS